jgi:hypothetical protein
MTIMNIASLREPLKNVAGNRYKEGFQPPNAIGIRSLLQIMTRFRTFSTFPSTPF